MPVRDSVELYDIGARLTQLILNREQALALLYRAPDNRYVLAAMEVLRREPEAGQRGGPPREQTVDIMDRLAYRPVRHEEPPPITPTERVDMHLVAEMLGRNLSDEQIADELDAPLRVVRNLVGRVMSQMRRQDTVITGAERLGIKGVE